MNRNFSILIYSVLIYLFIILLGFLKPWFIFIDSNILIPISLFFLVFACILFYQKNLAFTSLYTSKISIIIISLISIGFMISLPIRNLHLGDGIILLENLAIETKTYGYQIVMDELLEAMFHSRLYDFLNTDDPRLAYRILSTLAGIITILLFLRTFSNKKHFLYSILILLGSNGILIYYGYFENYSLLTLHIFGFIFLSIHLIENNKKGLKYLLLLSAYAAFGALLHLVYGYTLLALVFLCLVLSEKKDFLRNAILSSAVAGVLLCLFFAYFFFLADLRIDPSQGHITNPRFYPIRKLISTHHFKELFSCMIFTSLPALSILLYTWIFENHVWKSFYNTTKGKFLLSVFLGFLIHGFIYDPQLGFPADWDLMSFYWIPLVFISIEILPNLSANFQKLSIVFFLFSFLIVQLNAWSLHKEDPIEEKKVTILLEQVHTFSKTYKEKFGDTVPKNQRKFHVRTDFFLYRTKQALLQKKESANPLLMENQNLQESFEKQFPDFNKQWKKEFLSKATRYHEKYLDLMKDE